MTATTVYSIVTNKIMEALRRGIIPWRKPWSSYGTRPFNAETMREYSGGNMFLLSMLPYETPAYLTFNQIKKLGGIIKAGQEKNHFPVFYWKWLERTNEVTGKSETFPMLRYFLVWNIEQVEGIDLSNKIKTKMETGRNNNKISAAENIVKGYIDAPQISIFQTDKAFYCPKSDKIVCPHINQFSNVDEYYSTLFHEMGHSTGHKSRLNRKELNEANYYGSHAYSLEELIAELTSAFLCAESGIDNTIENSAAYIKAWLDKLGNDPKMFWTASGRAQKAAEYILGRNREREETDNN